MVRVSASDAERCGFAPQPGHIMYHHKNGTNCLPALHACIRVGVWQCNLTVRQCEKGWGMCGTVYGDMHLKDLMGSIARVGYCIPVPDFYLVLKVLRCQKSTIMD